jgi:hypothetical protein
MVLLWALLLLVLLTPHSAFTTCMHRIKHLPTCTTFNTYNTGTGTRRCNNAHASAFALRAELSPLNLLSALGIQGKVVGAVREGWKFEFKVLLSELAPSSKTTGAYIRPKSLPSGIVPSAAFPLELGRYHVYVGNPCPWCHR